MKRANGVCRDRNDAWHVPRRFVMHPERICVTVTLHVCTTCRGNDPTAEPRLGAQLHAALQGAPVRVVPVECLSACKTGCAVALSGPGRWSYVYGHMTPDDAAQILEGAARYAASDDGLVPWRERPEIFRKRAVARLPPAEV